MDWTFITAVCRHVQSQAGLVFGLISGYTCPDKLTNKPEYHNWQALVDFLSS